jgi:hypothetical protein
MDMKRDYYEDVELFSSPVIAFWFLALLAALAIFPFAVKNYYVYPGLSGQRWWTRKVGQPDGCDKLRGRRKYRSKKTSGGLGERMRQTEVSLIRRFIVKS